MKIMKKRLLFFGFIFLLGLPAAFAEDIAIIVNKENSSTDISFKDLVKIFKNEKQYWPDGKPIYLVTGPEREVILKKIYKMNDEQLKKFWLGEIFQGRSSSLPKAFDANDALKTFVSRVAGAVGFVSSSSVDQTVKVLLIDGAKPGDAGYPLSESSLK